VTLTNNVADSDADGTGNGGGILPIGTVNAKTIVAGNVDASAGGTVNPDISGGFTSLGNNLIGKSDGGAACKWCQWRYSWHKYQPHRSSAESSNGGSTDHALLPGSPAINAGNTGAPATDQRDFAPD